MAAAGKKSRRSIIAADPTFIRPTFFLNTLAFSFYQVGAESVLSVDIVYLVFFKGC